MFEVAKESYSSPIAFDGDDDDMGTPLHASLDENFIDKNDEEVQVTLSPQGTQSTYEHFTTSSNVADRPVQMFTCSGILKNTLYVLLSAVCMSFVPDNVFEDLVTRLPFLKTIGSLWVKPLAIALTYLIMTRLLDCVF